MSLMTAVSKSLGILGIVVFGLIVVVSLPVTTSAQGRGRGRDKDFEKSERKREKFINGHDARDGRWDGRGPSRSRERYFDDDFGRFRRQRNRDYYNDDYWRLRRMRHRGWNSYDDDGYRRLRRRGNFDDEDFRRIRRQQLLNRSFQDNYTDNGSNWGSLLNLLRR